MYLFLGLNGSQIEAPEEEVVALILSLAGGQLDESELASWLRHHISPR
jgi:death-on-curing protein